MFSHCSRTISLATSYTRECMNIHLYKSVKTRDGINNRLTIENPNRGVINSAVIRQTPHWYWIGGRIVPGGRAVVAGGRAVVAGGRAVVAGGRAVVAGGRAVVAGGRGGAVVRATKIASESSRSRPSVWSLVARAEVVTHNASKENKPSLLNFSIILVIFLLQTLVPSL